MDSSSNKTIQDHKNLTCSLCSRYYNDPRFLPCHHTFCFSCIKSLCDGALALSPTSPKKKKIVCPKCKVHFNVPSNGAEGFPVDYKTQALKDKVIQELAENISKSINNPKEDAQPSRFATASPFSDTKSSDYSSRNTYQSASDNENSTPYGRNSMLYGDYSKYAKYFSPESSVDNDTYFKPTIRADHTKAGYESSARFRNRRTNSRERQSSEEKELRRRTWYGSTLQSRRAQSLNRASMYAGFDEPEKNSPENLFKISEDKEQTTPTDNSSSMPTFCRTPLFRRSSFENNDGPSYTSKYGPNESSQSQTSSDKTSPTLFEKPTDFSTPSSDSIPKREQATFSPRSGFGGPTRTSLPTHKENVVTDTFDRQNSKEKKSSPVGPRISVKTRKKSPKTSGSKDKKLVSPSASPKRHANPLSPNFPESEPRTFVGSRHHRFKRSRDINESKEERLRDDRTRVNYDFTSRPPREPGRAQSAASREKLHLDINLPQDEETGAQHDHVHRQQDPSPRRSRSKKSSKARCKSVESRYSLNKNDFDSESEFREHLLNMTMSKEKYQHMMEDFEKGRLNNMRFDSVGSYDNDPEDNRAEVLAETEENKENIKIDANQENFSTQNVEDLKPSKPKEPLIDENLIISSRAKYSSPLDVKCYPKQDIYPEFYEGITKCWSYQKNDFGIPTSALFLNSGNLVVADYGQSCLEFFDSGGHLEHSVTGIKPFGLASSKDGKNIVVGDRRGKSIRIFDEFGSDVSQIDNPGTLEWMAGIAVRKDGGLVICDRNRCKILICTSGGEKVKEFGSFGSNSKQFCMADFLGLDSKNRIFVADSGNHCIKVFDPDGNPLKTIGSRGSGDGQFEWLKGIVIDEEDNLLIADTSNRRVSLFSPDGVFIKHLMSSVPEPYNIAWSKGSLAVLHYNLGGLSQCDVYSCPP